MLFIRLVQLASLATLLAGCDASSAPAPAVEPADPVLVSWWPLDGTGADSAGPNAATLVGVVPVVDRHARPDGALRFDGSQSFLSIPQPQGLDFDLRRESYTISLWVRGTGVPLARLLQKWDEDSDTGYAYSLQTTEDGIAAVVYDPPTTHIVEVPGVWDGSWRHIVVQYDATTRHLQAYRGGVRVGQLSAPVRRDTRNAASVLIGRAPEPVTYRFFRGDLDDVRIYRGVLSEAEIRSLAAE